MDNKFLNKNYFCFNEEDNGGEQLFLETLFLDNGDKITDKCDGIFLNQKLTLQSYSNCCSLELTTASFTPSKLRDLANQLESAYNKAKSLKE